MGIETVLFGLQARAESARRARELAHMGYVQWLAGLDGRQGYAVQARAALAQAVPFRGSDPAVAAFCEVIEGTLAVPLVPLELVVPARGRRGGARARRDSL